LIKKIYYEAKRGGVWFCGLQQQIAIKMLLIATNVLHCQEKPESAFHFRLLFLIPCLISPEADKTAGKSLEYLRQCLELKVVAAICCLSASVDLKSNELSGI